MASKVLSALTGNSGATAMAAQALMNNGAQAQQAPSKKVLKEQEKAAKDQLRKARDAETNALAQNQDLGKILTKAFKESVNYHPGALLEASIDDVKSSAEADIEL